MKLHIFKASNTFWFHYEKQPESILEIEVTEAQKKILEHKDTTLAQIDKILQDISWTQWWIKLNDTANGNIHKTK